MQQADDALCGQGNADCDVKVLHTQIPSGLYPPLPGVAICDSLDPSVVASCQLGNLVHDALNSLTTNQYDIADAVYAELQSPSPTFSSYAGGSLQSAFIQQWQAIQAPASKIRAVLATLNAAQAQITAASAVFQGEEQTQNYECSPQALAAAISA